MGRPNKTLRHNILIVCEGENTEPQYFSSLKSRAKKAWANTNQLFIGIKPKPKLEEEQTLLKPSKHKSTRKRRALKNVKIEPTVSIEDAYKAVPVRYVREAQQGLEDRIYEEVWAVFDKDYHPKHKEAFKLAEQEINGKKVQIAFSSISFEHWILLHFERNITTFKKSECKENNKPINCGTGNHVNDCYGANCVSGHLKTSQYLPSYSKSATASFFSNLHSNVYQAIENAAWLRYQILKNKPSTPIYELNPYTNMDKLVRHLLQIQEEVVWIDFNKKRYFEGIIVEFFQKSATEIQLTLTNQMDRSYIFLPEHLSLHSNKKSVSLNCKRHLMEGT